MLLAQGGTTPMGNKRFAQSSPSASSLEALRQFAQLTRKPQPSTAEEQGLQDVPLAQNTPSEDFRRVAGSTREGMNPAFVNAWNNLPQYARDSVDVAPMGSVMHWLTNNVVAPIRGVSNVAGYAVPRIPILNPRPTAVIGVGISGKVIPHEYGHTIGWWLRENYPELNHVRDSSYAAAYPHGPVKDDYPSTNADEYEASALGGLMANRSVRGMRVPWEYPDQVYRQALKELNISNEQR